MEFILGSLTKKAEPPPTRGVNRDSGTASANGGWLRRLVRPQAYHFDLAKDGNSISRMKIHDNATPANMKHEILPLPAPENVCAAALDNNISAAKKHPNEIKWTDNQLSNRNIPTNTNRNNGAMAEQNFNNASSILHQPFRDVGIKSITLMWPNEKS
jgi:hypothetical protein